MTTTWREGEVSFSVATGRRWLPPLAPWRMIVSTTTMFGHVVAAPRAAAGSIMMMTTATTTVTSVNRGGNEAMRSVKEIGKKIVFSGVVTLLLEASTPKGRRPADPPHPLGANSRSGRYRRHTPRIHLLHLAARGMVTAALPPQRKVTALAPIIIRSQGPSILPETRKGGTCRTRQGPPL